MSDYDQLINRVLALLTGDMLPSNGGWYSPEREEQRIAATVCNATGLTPEHWSQLSRDERIPWLNRTVGVLAARSVPNTWHNGDDLPVFQADAANDRFAMVGPGGVRVRPIGDSAESQLPADPPADKTRTEPGEARKPRQLLTGWREITDALDMKYSVRNKIKSLNTRFGGPIKNQGGGTWPMVYRDELIEWWEQLAVRAEAAKNRRAGARASAEAQHNFGREGTAAPEIGGGVRKRRGRKPT